MSLLKQHFNSLFELPHRALTLRYLVMSVVLILASQIAGIKDNLLGITAMVTGVCFLFYSLVHPWKGGRNYTIMAWICAGIIALIFAVVCSLSWLGFDKYLSGSVTMYISFVICLSGIIVGILGAVLND
jgi:hypothetical protein